MKQSTFYINAWYSKLYRFIYGPEIRLTDITNKEIFIFKLLIGTLLYLPLLVTFNFITSIIAIFVKKELIKNRNEYEMLKIKYNTDVITTSKELDDFFKYEKALDLYSVLRYEYLFMILVNFITYLALLILSSILYDLYIIIDGIINNYNGLIYIFNFNSPVLFKDEFALLGIASVIALILVAVAFTIIKLVDYTSNNKTIEIKPRNNIKWAIKS